MKTGPVDRPRRFIAPHYPPARWTDSTQRSTNKTGVNERQHDRFEKKNKTERSESETKAAKWSAGRSGRGPWIITSPFLFFFSFSLLSLSLLHFLFVHFLFIPFFSSCVCVPACVCLCGEGAVLQFFVSAHRPTMNNNRRQYIRIGRFVDVGRNRDGSAMLLPSFSVPFFHIEFS